MLTVSNPDWYYAADSKLWDDHMAGTVVKRTPMLRASWIYHLLNPFRIGVIDRFIRQAFLHPDPQIGWLPFAYRRALRIIADKDIRAIYSTSAPLTCHLVAALIKKRTGIPWIADFRDEWFENPDLSMPTPFHRKLHYRLEQAIVRSADRVTAPAAVFLELLSKHEADPEKFHLLPMGYDPDDFSENHRWRDTSFTSEKFLLTFSGLFYRAFRPTNLLVAVNRLIKAGEIRRDKIKLRFVGANTPDDLGCHDIYDICEFTGFVSHKRALGYIAESSALLLLLSDQRGRNVVPSKTFEYLASGKPIFALVPPEGEVARIIRTTRGGIIADIDDIDAVALTFKQFFNAWANGKPVSRPDWNEISKFNIQSLTGDLTGLLNRLSFNQEHISNK